MPVTTAATIDAPALLELFNASYSDYVVPLSFGPDDLDEHVTAHAIDLGLSKVVDDGGPAAFALVGRRGATAWIGGMGTRPERRRRGLGERALRAAIAAALEAGASAVDLEVIVGNDRAIALYEKLGFTRVRELVVGQVGPGRAPPRVLDTVAPLDAGVARSWIAARRPSREPWQRSDAAIDALRERGITGDGLEVTRAGARVGAALLRDQGNIAALLQIAARDADAAAALLAAGAADRPLRVLNAPAGEPAAAALTALDALIVARQYEMRLVP